MYIKIWGIIKVTEISILIEMSPIKKTDDSSCKIKILVLNKICYQSPTPELGILSLPTHI